MDVDYDEEEAQREEETYQVPAIVERRRLIRRRLDLGSGETVLSIGCGPGYEPAEIAESVEPNGRVYGVDRSEAMLRLAKRRCDGLPSVTLVRGDAVDLPVASRTIDAAVAVQSYEYVEDAELAIEELRRVLRPGGRAVVYDTDFDSLVWRSTDPERMERVLDAWNDHCPRPHLGSRLAPHFRNARLIVKQVEPNTILDTRLDGDSFVHHFLRFLESYIEDHDDISPDEAKEWVEDIYALDEAGETFFSLTQYLYVVRRPG